QRFRNALRDMTVNVGRGHPSAIGVMFNASNQGGIFRATIRSEDGSGAIGLDLRHADEVGPCLIQRVTVDGFACGIQTAYQTASQTFEHITLRGQSVCGWQNGFSQQIFARKLRSENAVTAIMNRPAGGGDPGQAKFALVEAELIGHGGAAQHAAIRNQKALYLRDVATSGYHAAVTRELDHGRGNPAPDAAVIGEYWANGADDDRRRGGPLEVFPSPDRSLRLPINEEPEVPWDADFARWAGPHQLASGSSGNGAGFPGDGQDDTAALQHALDSGASTVYLPNGVWNLHGSVNVPSGVTRIIGCEARLLGEGTSAGRICIAGNGDPLIIERLEAPGVEFEQSGERALVLKNLLGGSYRRGDAAQVGDLYLSDVCVSACAFRDQKVWARQLNIEGNTAADPAIRAKVFNDGGDVWILGMKNEDEGTVIETVGGGRTELIALHVGASGDEPRFITRTPASRRLPCMADSRPLPSSSGEARQNRSGQTGTPISHRLRRIAPQTLAIRRISSKLRALCLSSTTTTLHRSTWLPSRFSSPRWRLFPFLLWLTAFYSAWLAVVCLGDWWKALADHWGIAAAMAVGSYFAGSTPMGGGTVGFPVLVLLFDGPPALGRDFSFAIQSVGMTSASIFILCSRQRLEWRLLGGSLLGALVGTPLGVLALAPFASDLLVKLLFAVLWASFGVLHFWKVGEIAANFGITPQRRRREFADGILIGLLGGATVASVTGVGVDMLLYAVMVLLYRADLKIAVPCSVILMAFTSLVGLATKSMFGGGLREGVFENWLAAAPVVALGAPFGALIVAKIGRKPTLILVSALCLLQFVWTAYVERERLGAAGLVAACAAVAVFNAGFYLMYRAGRKYRSVSE
ncbi:MAG: TSUP family transporter, partial [Verrucomicrobiales bacterium]